MATYFRFSANTTAEISAMLGMYSFISDILYHGDQADIIISDIALSRVIIVETSSEIAENFED